MRCCYSIVIENMKIICLVSFIILAVGLSASETSAEKRDYVDLLLGFREIVDKFNELRQTSYGFARHVAIVELYEFLGQSEVVESMYALPYFARRTLKSIILWVSLHAKVSSVHLQEVSDVITEEITVISEAVRNHSQELGDQLQISVEQLKERGIVSIEVTINELTQIMESDEFQEIFDRLPEDIQDISIRLYEDLVDSQGYNFITDAISNVFDKISNAALVTKVRELVASAKQSVGAARDFAILKLKEILDGQSFKEALSSLGTSIQTIVQKGIDKVTDMAISAYDRVNQMVAKALTQGAVLIEAFKTKTQELTTKLQEALDQLNAKVLAVQEQGRTTILQLMQNEKVQKLLENMSPEVQDAANKLLEALA